MNAEPISFRLALAVSGLALGLMGSAGLYYHYAAAGIQHSVEDQYAYVRRSEAACRDHPKTAGICEPDWLAAQRDLFESEASARDTYRKRGATLVDLAFIIPFCAFAIFYIGRWIIAGRLRPLWPLGKRRSDPDHVAGWTCAQASPPACCGRHRPFLGAQERNALRSACREGHIH